LTKQQPDLITFSRIIALTAGLIIFVMHLKQAAFGQIWLPIFIILVALIRLAEVELPQGDKITLDTSVIVAAMLLFDLSSALTIAVGGMLVATFSHRQKPDFGAPLFGVAQRSIVVTVAGLWTGGRYVTAIGSTKTLNLLGWDLTRAVGLCLTFFLLEIVLDQLALSHRQASPFIPAFLGSFTLIGPIYFSLASVGVLMSMMYPSMGMWGVFLFGLPLIVVHYSFKLFLDIKNTYRHTIAALTRAIQVEDHDQQSHSERVAELAIDVGRELGLHGEKLESLGYAAMLHDIGKLGLDVDSFDVLLDSRRMNPEIAPHAQIGAEILEQVGFLKKYADVVRKHHLPFSPRRNVDQEHPLEARIIAAANYYDQLTQTPIAERRLSTNQAVARIKKESFQFDPKVLRALINVLRRQQRLIVTTV